MFMLNKIYLNLNLNQFSWLLNKHKLYEKLRIRNRGFEIPNHLTKDSNPDSNPMCYISKGFESAESESGFGFGPIPGLIDCYLSDRGLNQAKANHIYVML